MNRFLLMAVALVAVLLAAGPARTAQQDGIQVKVVSLEKKTYPRVGFAAHLRIRNGLSQPLFIGFNGNDAEPTLNKLCGYIERFDGKQWRKVQPAGALLLGDGPPRYLEIRPANTVEVRFDLYPAEYDLNKDAALRITMLAGTDSAKETCRPTTKYKVSSGVFRLPVMESPNQH